MNTQLHLTTAEYDQMVARGAFDHLDRKIELIRGELHEMNPAGPMHNDLIDYLLRWSASNLPQSVRLRIQACVDLRKSDSRPEPDIMWLREDNYRNRHPVASDVLLAIEVSDSSLERDLGLKAELYAEAGIVEYWVVDAGSKTIHVFLKPEQGRYQSLETFAVGQRLAPQVAPECSLDIDDLFNG